jgi:carbonic anhydrase
MLFAGVILCIILCAPNFISAKSEGSRINPDEALARLQEGNQRFLANARTMPHTGLDRLQELVGGQHPFATVITCSDSRVPPEYFFDVGFGDIFTIRVAGNVCDTDEVGSIEYGVDHLGTPLMLVLGHSHCGAVTAVVQDAEVHGNIPELVDNIIPAVEKVKHEHPELAGDQLITASIKENVWQSIDDLFRTSPATRERVRQGHLKIVGAILDIETGKIEWLGTHPNQDKLLQYTSGPKTKSGFVHVVYFWLKEGVTDAQRNRLVDDCKTYLGAVETVNHIEVGIPAGTERSVVDNSYGVCLILHFEDKAGHDYYQKAEKHLRFIERNQEIWDRVQVYDMIPHSTER